MMLKFEHIDIVHTESEEEASRGFYKIAVKGGSTDSHNDLGHVMYNQITDKELTKGESRYEFMYNNEQNAIKVKLIEVYTPEEAEFMASILLYTLTKTPDFLLDASDKRLILLSIYREFDSLRGDIEIMLEQERSMVERRAFDLKVLENKPINATMMKSVGDASVRGDFKNGQDIIVNTWNGGTPVVECDTPGCGGLAIVDGCTNIRGRRGSGPWACACTRCAEHYEISLGLGRGQLLMHMVKYIHENNAGTVQEQPQDLDNLTPDDKQNGISASTF